MLLAILVAATRIQHNLPHHLVQRHSLIALSLPRPLSKERQICLVFTIRALRLLIVLLHVHEESHQGFVSVTGSGLSCVWDLILQSRGQSLVSKYLLAMENFFSEADFNRHLSLLVNDSFPGVAVIHKKLLVADH